MLVGSLVPRQVCVVSAEQTRALARMQARRIHLASKIQGLTLWLRVGEVLGMICFEGVGLKGYGEG
jgi:hypothetical protein